MNTLKRAIVALVVVFVGFAATGCASTGYLGPKPFDGPLGDVVAGNLALTCPGDYFVGPPVNRCLQHLTNVGPHLSGYPIYVGSRGGRQLSRTEKIALVGAASAAACGTFSRDWRVIAGCAAAGAVTTAVVTRGRNGQEVRVGQDGVPVAAGRPVTQGSRGSLWGPGAPFDTRPNCIQDGRVTLQNLTGDPLKVFLEGQYDKPVAVLQPREAQCTEANLRYEAQVLQTAVSADGWVGSTQHQPRKPEARPGLVLVWR